MALSVIGAGFGRTGTLSMKLALEALGYGPCHHMASVVGDPAQLALWRAAAAGRLPDWDEAYAGFRSAVDWPTSFYWRELSSHYPDAKILLTVRSPESWYESMSKTVGQVIGAGNDPASFGVRIIGETIFGGRFEDRAHAIAVYERHNAEVRSAFPPERLLVFELGEGWERLCRFLGEPVPAIPFPQTNSTEEFRAKVLTK
jgi:Sulfotransferase domain